MLSSTPLALVALLVAGAILTGSHEGASSLSDYTCKRDDFGSAAFFTCESKCADQGRGTGDRDTATLNPEVKLLFNPRGIAHQKAPLTGGVPGSSDPKKASFFVVHHEGMENRHDYRVQGRW